MSTFAFKHFSIRQTNAAMKVGTDSMLLGSIARFDQPATLLDLGAGTGVLSLMIAQRYPNLQITALEYDAGACEDARHNFSQGAFPSCTFDLQETDIRQWKSGQFFDAIISNPPYFGDSYKSPNVSRNKARHTDNSLGFAELIECASTHLSQNGLFWVILPFNEKDSFTKLCTNAGLFPVEIVHILGKPEQAVRVILAFGKNPRTVTESVFTVRTTTGSYTEEYIRLTGEYHAIDLRANN